MPADPASAEARLLSEALGLATCSTPPYDDLAAMSPQRFQRTEFILAHSFDGYSTNVPVKDLRDGQAMIAVQYEEYPITSDHGGPAQRCYALPAEAALVCDVRGLRQCAGVHSEVHI